MEGEFKCSAGPYSVEERVYVWAVRDKNGQDVICLSKTGSHTTNNRTPEEIRANAYLFAAAPELLKTLELSRGNVASLNETHPKVWGKFLEVIDAAIAKAKGGA